MKIFIISRTNYDEPKRIRQQLADLLAEDYDIIYCQPNNFPVKPATNISYRKFYFINRFSSIPFVNVLNAYILRSFIRKNVKIEDIIINFMPELGLINLAKYKVISFLNDDFASMAPSLTQKWLEYLTYRMINQSRHALFSSKRLLEKYAKTIPSDVFYPWATVVPDETKLAVKRNRIVFWGYIGQHLDFEKVEELLVYIRKHDLDYFIEFFGPVEPKVSKLLSNLHFRYSKFKFYPPCSFEELKPESIAFALVLIKPGKKFASFGEVPNKTPNFIVHGIPLAYSGINPKSEIFFFEFQLNKKLFEFSEKKRSLIKSCGVNYMSKSRHLVISKILGSI
jgi:hypothetical protein